MFYYIVQKCGGNDIGFSKIIKECIEIFGCDTSNTVRNNLNSSFSSLPSSYDALAADIKKRFQVSNILITEYPDPTHNEQGHYCDSILGLYGIGISHNEAQWAHNEVLMRLNQAVYDAAKRNGWTYVGGIASKFNTHGYCAGNQRWYVTLDDSQKNLGSIDGTMHPNMQGQSVYRDRLFQEVEQTLFRYEGVVTGYVYAYPQQGLIPLYHYFNAQIPDHLYTIEKDDPAFAAINYDFRGIAAYIYPSWQRPPLAVPIYSYYNSGTGDHFVGTTNDTAGMATIGYGKEHIIGYVYPNQIPGAIPFYSYYNDATAHHFYTITRAEMEPGTPETQ